MTKEQYLHQLCRHLRKLPKQDFDDAMDYFTEYFAETDEEEADLLMKELGTPKEAAADLLVNLLEDKLQADGRSNHAAATADGKKAGGKHIIWIAILSIMAAPIGLPLLICLAAIVFSLVVTAAAVIFSFAVIMLCALLLGIWLILRGITAIPANISGALVIAGSGLTSLGLGALLALLCYGLVVLCRRCFVWIARQAAKTRRKSNKQGGDPS